MVKSSLFFSFWSCKGDLLSHEKKSDDLTLKFVFSYRTTFTSFQLEELKIWVPNLHLQILLSTSYFVCLFVCLFVLNSYLVKTSG